MPQNAKAKREARARKERTGESYVTALRHVAETERPRKRPPDHPWMCVTCKLPIKGASGIIEIVNSNPDLGAVGSYPKRASDDRALLSAPNVKFLAYHTDGCMPYPDEQGYWISSERCATLPSWCAWVYHLFEKTWLSREDLARLLSFWFTNRGQDVHRLSG